MMKLYGSIPSPYVRRIRLLLAETPYEFCPVNVFEDISRAEFNILSPIKKLPVLVDGEQVVFDSHVIFEYLQERQGLSPLTVADQNVISVVDAVTDSLIILLMGKRSELAVDADVLLFKLQRERIPDCLQWLEAKAEQGEFVAWKYSTMALLAMMDWAEFRELYEFSNYPSLRQVRASHQSRAIVQSTLPSSA